MKNALKQKLTLTS